MARGLSSLGAGAGFDSGIMHLPERPPTPEGSARHPWAEVEPAIVARLARHMDPHPTCLTAAARELGLAVKAAIMDRGVSGSIRHAAGRAEAAAAVALEFGVTRPTAEARMSQLAGGA